MERTELTQFDYELEIQKDQGSSTVKLEENHLPQVKFEPDITDEEVVETKCIPPPIIWMKKELVSFEDEVVETKCIPPTIIWMKKELVDDRKDALEIEHLVENEFESVSFDSSSSTVSAPETRIIEDYLPVYKSEQTTIGGFSECVDRPTGCLENVLPTCSYGSISTVLQHDHCYFRLPKAQVRQNPMPDSQGPTRCSSEPNDDTCSDSSSNGSENSEPKKRQRISYIGDYTEEDLADPQKVEKFAEASNSTIIRQEKKINQLKNELKELGTEYNSLKLKLQTFLNEYYVPNEVLKAAIQECGMNKCPINLSKYHTRKKD